MTDTISPADQPELELDEIFEKYGNRYSALHHYLTVLVTPDLTAALLAWRDAEVRAELERLPIVGLIRENGIRHEYVAAEYVRNRIAALDVLSGQQDATK